MNDYLAKIIDAANEGIYVTDRERRFLLWNEAAERISGYGKNEIIGRSCYDNILCHIDQEGRELCLTSCPLKAAIDDGESHGPAVVHLRHKSGRRIPVEVRTAPVRNDAGEVIGGVELFQDVTERLEHQRLLKERQDQLETVLNSIGDGILFLDTEGAITVFNHAGAEMFGLDRASIGMPIHALPDPLPLKRALQAAECDYQPPASATINGAPAECRRFRSVFRCWTLGREDGPQTPRFACTFCAAYRSARAFLERPRELSWGDRVLSVVSSFIESGAANELWEVVVFHDVTAEKLDAVLKVAGAAAHELRQPLQAIVILAGLIEKGVRKEPTLSKQIVSLQTSCDRMDQIIQRMTEITRYQTKEYLGGRKILDIEHSSGRG